MHLVLPHHSFFCFYIFNRSAVTHTEPMLLLLLLLQSTSSMNKELHFSVSDENLVLGLVFVLQNVKHFILVIKDFI